MSEESLISGRTEPAFLKTRLKATLKVSSIAIELKMTDNTPLDSIGIRSHLDKF